MNNYFIKDPVGGERVRIFITFQGGDVYSKHVHKLRNLRFWIVNRLLRSMQIKIEVRHERITPNPYRQEKIEAEFYKAKELKILQNQERVVKQDADYEKEQEERSDKKDAKLKQQHE